MNYKEPFDWLRLWAACIVFFATIFVIFSIAALWTQKVWVVKTAATAIILCVASLCAFIASE